jgi:hypothetical protein
MLAPVVSGPWLKGVWAFVRDSVASSPQYTGEPKGILVLSVGLVFFWLATRKRKTTEVIDISHLFTEESSRQTEQQQDKRKAA